MRGISAYILIATVLFTLKRTREAKIKRKKRNNSIIKSLFRTLHKIRSSCDKKVIQLAYFHHGGKSVLKSVSVHGLKITLPSGVST